MRVRKPKRRLDQPQKPHCPPWQENEEWFLKPHKRDVPKDHHYRALSKSLKEIYAPRITAMRFPLG